MSPYLFLLVADVLQALIKHENSVRNPLDHAAACSVLQYADDTLILLRGELADVQHLKHILYQFSAATGLLINYHKSTAAPLHMEEQTIPQCIAVLGCRQECFPQTYLGLPLSCDKLKISAFDPYICKTDRYLAGWQASFLNPMGRTVLINAVLDGQLSYIMMAVSLPPGVIAKIDKRRRSFLWTGKGEAHGSNCLIAWDQVRQCRDQGGLGIKDLAIQNICLLLKLLHKLHAGQQSSWATWVRQHTCLASLTGDLQGAHWDSMRSLLPLYQAVTTVTVGDGQSTSFWHDIWFEDECFSERFHVLHSHCKRDDQSVAVILNGGFRNHLVPRLSAEAAAELTMLEGMISQVALSGDRDKRHSPFADNEGKLHTKDLYSLLKCMGATASSRTSIFWRSCAPPRVQFFAWLLVHERIQCKATLARRMILPDSTCELCGDGPEMAVHLLFHCDFAASFWRALGFAVPTDLEARHIQQLPRPSHVEGGHYDTFILLCCWQLWKRQNGIVFRQETKSLHQTLHACRREAKSWSCRLPCTERRLGDHWCSLFSLAM